VNCPPVNSTPGSVMNWGEVNWVMTAQDAASGCNDADAVEAG
jgi:hypothetical protein